MSNDDTIESFYQGVRDGSIKQDELSKEIGLLAKVANQSSLEDFSRMIQDGELPPIELTDQEMEQMQGGGWRDWWEAYKRARKLPKNTEDSLKEHGIS